MTMANSLYNGIELPELQLWDTYGFPNALIYKSHEDNNYTLILLSSRPYYGTNPSDGTKTGVYCVAPRSMSYSPQNGKWSYCSSSDYDICCNDGETTIVWTNMDILNESDESIWMKTTKPAFVANDAWIERFKVGFMKGVKEEPLSDEHNEPVGYSYGGYRLPTIPDPATVLKDGKPCKYALLYPVDVIDGRKRFYVLYNDVPFQPVGLPEYHADYYYGGYYQFNFGPIGLYPRRRITEGERDWYEWPNETDLSITFTTHHILWVSHDISYTLNGKEQVILWHEEPVPICKDPWFWEVTE